jgi:hypothetical protein
MIWNQNSDSNPLEGVPIPIDIGLQDMLINDGQD